MAELFDKIGWVSRILALVAYLVCRRRGRVDPREHLQHDERAAAGVRDPARAGGAKGGGVRGHRAESVAIAALGALCGFVIYTAIMLGGAAIVRSQTGVAMETLQFHPVLILAPVAITALGALCGLVPAFKAYRTDVAANLVPNS